MKSFLVVIFIFFLFNEIVFGKNLKSCNNLSTRECCNIELLTNCFEQCQLIAVEHCPEMYHSRFGSTSQPPINDIRKSPTKSSSSQTFLSVSQRYKEFGMCGAPQNNYIPCISRWKANRTFQKCCEKFVDKNCTELCRYETNELQALIMLKSANKKGCSMQNLSAILYCAAQNRNNKNCCKHMEFGVDETKNCMRFCNPSDEKIEILQEKDLICIRNWNVLMYCHLSGLT